MGIPILTVLKYASALKEIPDIFKGINDCIKVIKKAVDPNGKGGKTITPEEFDELSEKIDYLTDKVENIAKVFK